MKEGKDGNKGAKKFGKLSILVRRMFVLRKRHFDLAPGDIVKDN